MKRIIGLVALAGALAVPVMAAAEGTTTDKQNASKECKAMRTAMGTALFNSEYGKNKNDKNAFGKCVSKTTREEAAERKAARSNAAKDCKAEQAMTDDQFKADPAHNGKTFAEFYGAKNANSAYGKCVSTKAKQNKAEADQADKDKVNAAKFCKGERDKDPAAFKTTYSTFGKCVSKKAHELNAERKQERESARSA